jgi:hypothetical protein
MGRAQRLASPIAGDLRPRMMPRWQMPNGPRGASKAGSVPSGRLGAGLVVQVGRGRHLQGEDGMRRFGASVLIAAAAVAGLTPVETATAVQANCQTDIPVIGDVDGDGRSDLIVGVPGRSSNTGEVDLRLTTAPSKTLSQQDAGLGQGIPGDEFGAAWSWPT